MSGRRGARSAAWLFALALLMPGCTSKLDLRSSPHRVQVSLDGRLVAERTPVQIAVRRPAFGRPVRRLRLEAEGHVPLEVPVRLRPDSGCVTTCLAVAILGSPTLVPTIVGLLYLPWCTRLDPSTLDLELEAMPREAAAASAGAR